MGRAAMKTEATEVQWKLSEWAHWRHSQSGSSRGYPNQTPFRRLFGGSIPTAMISDDDASNVDRAVCRLMQRNERQAQVLVLYYVEGMTVQQASKRLDLSLEHARRLLAQAETAIEYLLEALTTPE